MRKLSFLGSVIMLDKDGGRRVLRVIRFFFNFLQLLISVRSTTGLKKSTSEEFFEKMNHPEIDSQFGSQSLYIYL